VNERAVRRFARSLAILDLMPKAMELWTKEVAAEYLSMSVRRLMELSAEGKPKRYREVDPETKREAVMFRCEEIKQMREESRAAVLSNALARVPRRFAIEAPAADRMVSLGQAKWATEASAAAPWLTLDDAAEYTGLPASVLQRFIEAGRLPAIDVGVRPGGHWRVKRSDLDAIQGDRLK
jgi:excisionase family DNA binding protein